jgi:D-xylose transport system substrate-binding protein
MEHIVTVLRRSVAFGALALAVAAAGTMVAPRPAGAKEITIAVAMKTQVQRRWAFDAAAMKREAEKLGAKLLFQWANDNPATQASQVENLLSQSPDALIIVPVDTSAASSIVDSAHQAKVPVVGYDIGVSGAKLDFFVMRNNPMVGQLQAEGALKFASKGTFALIKGDPGNDVAQAIAKEYNRLLVNNKNVKIVFNQFIRGWDPKTALADAENVLSAQNDKVDGFVTSNDGMATGVSQALKSRNLAGKVYLSGLDADPANLQLIAQDVQTMSVWTDLDEQGTSAVDAAFALASGKKPDIASSMVDLGAGPVPTHFVTVLAVNKENLCKFITHDAPSGWVTVKDVFPDKLDACN